MRTGIAFAAAAALLQYGCQTPAPASSAPAATAVAAKPAEAQKPPPPPAPVVEAPKPAVIDRTPIKADLTKIKFTVQNASNFGWDDGESRAFYWSNGLGEVLVRIPADGEYEVVVTASCQAAQNENAKFKLSADGAQVGSETTLKSEDAKEYSFTAALKAGERRIGVEFTNDIYKENEYDRNFFLNGLKVVRVK